MTRTDKILGKVLRGTADANVPFEDLRHLVRGLGFEERVRGSHRIFTRDDVEEILNLQARSDGKAKVYQVKQVRQVILKYKLGGPSDED